MTPITTSGAFHRHSGTPGRAATVKVAPILARACQAWVDGPRFCVLTIAGPERTDGSPGGHQGPAVRALDSGTLALPGRERNERIESDQFQGAPTADEMLSEISQVGT